MKQRSTVVPAFVCFLAILSFSLNFTSHASQSDEKGESKEQKALKNRSASPKQTDVDKSVNLEGMLSKKDQSDYSVSKAATVEGYVIQVEKEEDGDLHLALAPNAGETDTKKWVIVEVTPGWQKKKSSLSDAKIRQLRGKKVRVTGWLYYEMEEDQPDPRGTRWEIHPVTDITIVK